MKILVVHDEYGNIKSAAVTAGKPNLRAGLRPRRGEFVTELEAPAFGPQELRRDPHGLSKHFRVDVANARLVPKDR